MDQLTAHVGQYSAPPSSIVRPKLGVPTLKVEAKDASFSWRQEGNEELERYAADELTTLWQRSRRFRIIERAQLPQLLREQDLEGIVRADELAAMGEVHGVDYLCLAKVTNYEVKVDKRKKGFSIGGSASRLNEKLFGRADPLRGFEGGFDKQNTVITISCGVDLRLVDPSSGEVVVADFSDINRELRADSLGVDLDIFETTSDAEIKIDTSDAGKLLRLALDDAVRKLLPEIDEMLMREWDEDELEEAKASAAAAEVDAE